MGNNLDKLRDKLLDHRGEFVCSLIGDESKTSQFKFEHTVEYTNSVAQVPRLEKLVEFYNTFGSLRLFHNIESGDSAVFLANPAQWGTLKNYFLDWINDLDETEKDDLVPEWIDNCECIGEIPESGNYFLTPLAGNEAGGIFEFEHDGFEFIPRAPNIEEFVEQYLSIDPGLLTEMASHMRFITNDPGNQWWIEEMRDNFGAVVKTKQ